MSDVEAVQQSQNDKSIHILQVEDNEDDAWFFGKLLKKAYGDHFQLTTVVKLEDGLNYLRKSLVDVVILDLALPDSAGMDTVIRMQAAAPTIPIVIITGTINESLALQALQEGAQDYLVKGQTDGSLVKRAIWHATERKLAEVSLRKNEESLAKAQEISRMGSWEWNIVRDEYIGSQEMYRILNTDRESFGANYSDLVRRIHADDRDTVTAAFADALSNPQYVYDIEYRVMISDNIYRTVHALGEVEYNLQGLPLKMLGTLQDVSEHKKIEATLQQNEERLQLALESSNDGLWDWDVKQGTVYYSRRWFTMLGYQPEEWAHHIDTWRELLHPDDLKLVKRRWNQHTSEHNPFYEVEFRLKNKHGDWVWTLSRGRIVERDWDNEPMRAVGTHTDISERKRAETAIRKAKDDAQKADRTKSEFLANMSHEIRTPMNAIVGLTDLALRCVLTSKVSDYLNKIKSSSHALLGIINDILDFSKIEAGKLNMEYNDFNLQDVMNSLAEVLGFIAKEKKLEFIVSIAADVPIQIIGDPLRLGQILTNLANNAIKFTNKGRVAVHVVLDNDNNTNSDQIQLRFTVIDTGMGMTPQQQAGVFASFAQADESITRRFGGTGLGLAISKRLVEMMHGNIGVDSALHHGSTFWFTAQFKRQLHTVVGHDQKDNQNKKVDKYKALLRIKGSRVLLVEDNHINQQVAREMLESEGIHVEIANNGQEAVNKVVTAQPMFDAILMDLQMPVMDGYEATHHIRTRVGNTWLPIIAVTANAMSGDRQKCLDHGMNDHIAKPVDIDQLHAALARWVKPGQRTETKLVTKPVYDKTVSADTFPSKLPGIDINAGLKRLGGNAPLFKKLLLEFNRNNIDVLNVILNAIKQNNYDDVRHIVHTLKGMAGNLSAIELFAAAKNLEKAIVDDDRAQCVHLLVNLEKTLDEVFTSIQTLVKVDVVVNTGTDDTDNSVLNKARLTPLLRTFDSFLAANDMDASQQLEHLQKAIGNKQFQEELAHIEACVDSLDFKAARIPLLEIANAINISLEKA